MITHPYRLEKTAAVLALSIAFLVAPMQPAFSQAAAPPTAGGKPAFDAASVRPSTQELVLKGVDFLNPASDAAPPPGGLFSWNVQLPWLINFAYDLRSAQARREARQALPGWAQDDWFTIEARAEGTPSRDDVRQMVRSLLENRFQFAAHVEKREAQVYAIVLAKAASGLKPHAEGAPCTLSPSQADEKKYPHLSPTYQAVPAHCGIFGRELSPGGEHRLEMLNVTIEQIADSLGLGLPLLVVDNTGLAGRYDAVLDFGPDDVRPNTDSSESIGLPPLPGALEKQLGLKLVKRNAQVDSLVIGHIEPLSEN
jgi:uncharacterized protein (TIGR03435 family)